MHSKEFYQHRNELNEEEHLNVQMFETLNQKLSDEQFIYTAIENNKKADESKNNTLVQMGSSGPFDRESNPFEQFRQGPPGQGASDGPFDRDNNPFEQFRNAPSDSMGPVVQNGTTKTVKTVVKKVIVKDGTTEITTRNVTNNGAYRLTEGFEATSCASEGEQCSCLGQVHFGKKAGGFQAMHGAGNVSITDTRGANPNGFLSCDGKSFNVSNSTGGHECYCVREMAPNPLPAVEHCADDAGMNFCPCYGTVYYGRKWNQDQNKALSFAEMAKFGWTSALSTGDLLCASNSFDGDPDYGHDKQCFCAADPTYEPAPPIEKCALEKEKTDCVCSGTVYYGRANCPYDGEPLGLSEM